MRRKLFSYGGIVLLAGAAVLATPGLSRAQRGGGHAGGAHFGGGRVGGLHVGNYRGGFSHTYSNGSYRGGYPRTYGYARSGYRGYSRGYGYGYYPAYGYPYYAGTYYDAGPGLGYDAGYADSYTEPEPAYAGASTLITPAAVNYQSFYPPATAQPDTSAHLTVTVPANAQIWFDQTLTTSTGPVREFVTPSLKSGNRNVYTVRARWNDNGHEVTQTRQVAVTPGAHVNVRFPAPPEPDGKATAVTHR
jgi:uncharacterized protein (TIGR03000 family)